MTQSTKPPVFGYTTAQTVATPNTTATAQTSE